MKGLGDTFDLVPIGGWRGDGRKSEWISPFLLACWDPATSTFQSVCRVMSGFSDEFYKEQTKEFRDSDRAKEEVLVWTTCMNRSLGNLNPDPTLPYPEPRPQPKA